MENFKINPKIEEIAFEAVSSLPSDVFMVRSSSPFVNLLDRKNGLFDSSFHTKDATLYVSKKGLFLEVKEGARIWWKNQTEEYQIMSGLIFPGGLYRIILPGSISCENDLGRVFVPKNQSRPNTIPVPDWYIELFT